MQTFIDIHSHILPGVDDGARNMDKTIQMLTIAHQEGIQSIIATPHYEAGNVRIAGSRLMNILEEVQIEARKIDQDFQIKLGNEILFHPAILEALNKGEALTLNGTRYILIEFLPSSSYSDIRDGICRCILEGYIPIIAHVERYACLRKHMYSVEELIEAGAYIQMNIDAIRGSLFRPIARFCQKLLKQRWVHFLGTDAHGTSGRGPYVKKTLKYLNHMYGEDYIKDITLRNPKNLLDNRYI